MKTGKIIVIVTDGSAGTGKMAVEIAGALDSNDVSIKTASEFQGNDILPAEAFFLGCEEPSPDSFDYLADLLMHINLAGRPCGVFSLDSKKAAEYLSILLKDSEAALNPEPLFSDSADIKTWAQNVVSKSF